MFRMTNSRLIRKHRVAVFLLLIFIFTIPILDKLIQYSVKPYETNDEEMLDISKIPLLKLTYEEAKNMNQFNIVANEKRPSEINHLESKIFSKLEYPIRVYLRALRHSVRIVNIPFEDIHKNAMRDCLRYKNTATLFFNQHSLELRYPQMLLEMSQISSTANEKLESDNEAYGILCPRSNASDAVNTRKKEDETSTPLHHEIEECNDPLFYYLQSYVYHMVYCNNIRLKREDWRKGEAYLQRIARYVVQTKEWHQNMGIDFISPASHPKSGPTKVHPAYINLFLRQSFMRTDFDFDGYRPKDIIVPYYVSPISSEEKIMYRRQLHAENKTLLFFAGGQNPPDGLRDMLEENFESVISENHYKDIVFTTSKQLDPELYKFELITSDFCLSIRGDTASSRRLFNAIDAGCIPIIISDWILLPFENILDYSKFVIIFPESILLDVNQLIQYVRNISNAKVKEMKAMLSVVRTMLLYEPSANDMYLINPITFSLIEALITRKQYCDRLGDPTSNHMCRNIYKRLEIANSTFYYA